MMRLLIYITLLSNLMVTSHSQDMNVRESAYLQLNSNYLITGESMLYSAFVTSQATGLPTTLSKILYVELVGENNKTIFQHKIHLMDGRGHGQFFVPSLVSTGTYQLVAYTRWMRNFKQVFSTKVTIINPFEQYELPISKKPAFKVTFAPEGGAIIPDVANLIAFTTTDNSPAKGRIVSDQGEQIGDFESDANGKGRFIITPKAGTDYQVIVEDVFGEFHFYSLPKIQPEATIIQLRNSLGFYEFKCAGKIPSGAILTVHDDQNEILSQYCDNGQAIRLNKNQLKAGTYTALIKNGKETLTSRYFAHIQKASPTKIISEKYQKRSLVKIPIPLAESANLSVSIHKKDTLSSETDLASWLQFSALNQMLSSADWTETDNLLLTMPATSASSITADQEISLLPEVRGEIISGRVIPAMANQVVTYSTVGKEFQIKTAATNEQGQFWLQIDPSYHSKTVLAYAIGAEGKVSIELDDPFLTTYPDFDYSKPVLDSATIASLTLRSIRNQVENAYYELKKPEIISSDNFMAQFGTFDAHYVLDEYNRFPKMYEHFVEYVPSVVARQNNSRSKIKVHLTYPLSDEKPPLLLLDGVPVTEEGILNFSPYKIKTFDIVTNRIFLGPLESDGLVLFTTFDGDLMGYDFTDDYLKTTYQNLEPVVNYKFPQYDTRELDRIPDYREQLYWDPAFQFIPASSEHIEFYTSDIVGIYTIAIDGFSESGQPISLHMEFEVQ